MSIDGDDNNPSLQHENDANKWQKDDSVDWKVKEINISWSLLCKLVGMDVYMVSFSI